MNGEISDKDAGMAWQQSSETARLRMDDLVPMAKPSLADPAVVAWLVRHFSRRVLEIRDEKGSDDVISGIEGEARELGAIILGRDIRFNAQGWNDPDRLGTVLRVLLPEETRRYGDSGTALFIWLAAQIGSAARDLENGMSEQEVREKLDPVIEDVIEILSVRY